MCLWVGVGGGRGGEVEGISQVIQMTPRSRGQEKIAKRFSCSKTPTGFLWIM